MRSIFTLTSALLLSLVAQGQTRINPTSQINWPLLTGAGTPTAVGVSCASVNIGQPYQDTSVVPNVNWSCGTNGTGGFEWEEISGGTSVNLANGIVVGTGSGPSNTNATAANIAAPLTAVDSGSTNVYVLTTTPTVGSLVNNLTVSFLPNSSSTTPTPTANLDGLGAFAIVRENDASLAGAGDVGTNLATIKWNASISKWELQNPQNIASTVSNTDTTTTITPTHGNVHVAVNLASTNAWTGVQTIPLGNGSTAVTQTVGDNSTKVATDAFVLANGGSGPAANLAGGATGSAPYQSAPNTTAFIASPTTSGHTFVYSWQPTGSAIDPVALDLATYLASPGAIGGTTPNAGNFTTISATGPISSGATPPTACGSATGCLAMTEAATACTPTAGQACLRADSTTNTYRFSINGSAEAAFGAGGSPAGAAGSAQINAGGSFGASDKTTILNTQPIPDYIDAARAPLANWLQAMHNASRVAAHVVVIGDSYLICDQTICSTGPTVSTNRWVEQLRINLQAAYGYGGTGVMPLSFSTTGININTENYPATTGTLDNSTGSLGPSGSAGNALIHLPTGATVTFSAGGLTYDTLYVYCMTNSGSGSLAISIDSGAHTGTACGTTSGSPTAHAVSIAAGSLATHSAVATCTGNCYIYAMEGTAGTTGIRVSNLGYGGASSGYFGSSATAQLAFSDLEPAGTQGAIVMLQTNDITQSVAVSTFSTNMGNIVSHELALSPAPSVMLAVPPVDSATGSFPASAYTAAQQALYVADAIDLYNIQWQWGTTFNSASGLWSSDNIHPNDKGALSEFSQVWSKFVDNVPAQAPSSGSGLSGMTTGQVAVAGSANTITSSKALAGSGTAVVTGPTSSTSTDLVAYTGAAGQTADSGILTANVTQTTATPAAGQICVFGSTAKTCTPTSRTWSCQPGLGDGLNAIVSGTYLQTDCLNTSGVTWTITSIKCFTDNSGTSTMAVTNGAGTALLTGAVTCSSSFASGTQSGTTTIAAGDFVKFTFAADGASKQTTWVVSGTY